MRVHDEVGCDPLACERHVLLMVGDSTRALLPVATCKLVSYLWNTDGADANLAELVAILVDRQHYLQYMAGQAIESFFVQLTDRTQSLVAVTDRTQSSIAGRYKHSYLVHNSILTGPEESTGISLLVPLSCAR